MARVRSEVGFEVKDGGDFTILCTCLVVFYAVSLGGHWDWGDCFTQHSVSDGMVCTSYPSGEPGCTSGASGLFG
jgi:hypothetical protein